MSQANHLKGHLHSSTATRRVRHDQKEHFLHFKFLQTLSVHKTLVADFLEPHPPSKKLKAGDRGSIVEENTKKKERKRKIRK